MVVRVMDKGPDARDIHARAFEEVHDPFQDLTLTVNVAQQNVIQADPAAVNANASVGHGHISGLALEKREEFIKGKRWIRHH